MIASSPTAELSKMNFEQGFFNFKKWRMRKYILASIFIQIISISIAQFALDLMPDSSSDLSIGQITMSEMNFVEYNEVQEEQPVETQELSDEIIEKDKLSQEPPINWKNAADPALDMNQRYSAKLMVNISPDDYPSRAKRANLGIVRAAVTMYIDSSGRIRDVKIRNIRTQDGALGDFEEDFIQAARKILLQKTKLVNSPYMTGGQAKDFTWDTTISFTIQ